MAKLLNRSDKVPFDAVEDLGIALKITQRDPEQVHIGILYKLDNGGVRFCHFAADRDLRDEDPAPEYMWVQVVLEPIVRRFLASTVSAIASRKDPVRYGFPYEPPYFSETTFEYIQRPLGRGLTCATFVLAIFRLIEIDLLATATWPTASPEDMIWQMRISESERRRFLMVGEAMAEHIGAKRFFPQEVAAGSISTEKPIDYETARPIAEKIISELRKAA